MNFKNENNNNENMNNEVELNNNKGELKMNNKDIQNIEINEERLLNFKPVPLTQKEKEIINNLTEDYNKMSETLAYNIMNAFYINNAIRGIKTLNYQYRTDLKTLKTISPKLFKKCKKHINSVNKEIQNSRELKEEVKQLRINNINIDKRLLWQIHNYHKGVKALKQIDINKLGNFLGVVVYLIHTHKGLEPIRQIIDICCNGSDYETYKRKNNKSYGEIKI